MPTCNRPFTATLSVLAFLFGFSLPAIAGAGQQERERLFSGLLSGNWFTEAFYEIIHECNQAGNSNPDPETGELCKVINAEIERCRQAVKRSTSEAKDCKEMLKFVSGKHGVAMAGTWKGYYECAQGRTGVTDSVLSNAEYQLTARFKFFATPENPNTPEGEFLLAGEFQASTGRYLFKPATWLSQPAGYTMVGFSGTLDADKKQFRGSINSDGCGEIRLSRQF